MELSKPVTENLLQSALSSIPEPFKTAIISEYNEVLRCAMRSDWEKVGLKAGKICEIAYCILEGICTGVFPPAISKPKDMQLACKQLEQLPAGILPRAARIQIPRVIAATYELRNNRAIGHAGGDVVPNKMDGLFFLQSTRWILCEIIRIGSNQPIGTVDVIIDNISATWSPSFWESFDKKRLLIENLTLKEKVLGYLYFSGLSATITQLREWIGISNITNFRNRALTPLNDINHIYYDDKNGVINLLPPGIREFETRILKFDN